MQIILLCVFLLKHLYYFVISHESAPNQFEIESNFPKRVIECRPGDESDLEDYLETDDSINHVRDASIDFTPGDADPVSFKTAQLTNPELLFIIDRDS